MIRQVKAPNLNVLATRGWCLMFVDDAVGAANKNRQPSAQMAYNALQKAGRTRSGEPPVGVWVPIFFSLNEGPYAGLGHVAWAFNHGNGWVEIHDSETRPGARPVYTSIAQVVTWFGKYAPQYLGYAYSVDGVQVIEDYTPVSTKKGKLVSKRGTAKVTVDALNVRNDPSNDHAIVATYSKGQSFNYDSYVVADGFVWLSYMSYGGKRRYVAEGPDDGKSNNVWVSGGVS